MKPVTWQGPQRRPSILRQALSLATGGVAGLLAFVVLFAAILYAISLFNQDARKSASHQTSSPADR